MLSLLLTVNLKQKTFFRTDEFLLQKHMLYYQVNRNSMIFLLDPSKLIRLLLSQINEVNEIEYSSLKNIRNHMRFRVKYGRRMK